ncbi:putative ATPase/DNA-binding CsgD family transcriptional regulator [Marmoricola sp. OAE513]|uniref:ATP-binding protein n=1 Tax=Marmoricola sp. OAE513 TaxID=2817894 RepID=UPI001D8F1D96
MSTRVSSSHAPLVGRLAEVAEVERLLAPGRVLTLTGVGGAGKTRIARRLTAATGAGYPGSWVVELADFVDDELLGELVAGALDLQVPPGNWDGSVLAAYFADRPGLLVLDNCEHLVDAVALLAAQLLGACPGLTLLATSRIPLGISAETVYQVPPMSPSDSSALYEQRATEAMAAFRLTESNAPAVEALVARLDGVPLSIELAAARVRLLGPDALLGRLEDRFDALQSDLRDVPARQRSLAASVGWSYELCRPEERELWNRLSVFSGGFELEAAESICSGAGIEETEVLGLLAALVDMSVVARVGETGSRFRMLEPIRQYGAERLDVAGGTAPWRARHLAWYADLVDRLDAAWFGPDQLVWMDRLRAEHPNLRLALEHALSDASTAPVALRMCRGLEPLWVCGGHLGEARRLIERAVALTPGERDEKVKALRLCAWFGALQLDLGYASDRVREASELLEGGDDLVQGYFLFADGVVATWAEDFARGVDRMTASRAAFERAGHLPGVLEATLNTAIAHVFAADYDQAGELARTCLALTEPLGESYVDAYARWVLGLTALMSGDLDAAVDLCRDALLRSTSLGDRLATVLELETLGWTAAIQFDVEHAVLVLGGAQALWRMLNMPAEPPGIAAFRATGEPEIRAVLGDAAYETGYARGLAMDPVEVVDLALGKREPQAVKPRSGPLSRRETEVAALVAEGMSNRDIAEALFLSERTAQGHVQSILRKLDFRSRSQIAVWFVGQQASQPHAD